MKITDYNFLNKLKEGKVSCSSISKSIKEKDYFSYLLRNKIIELDGTWHRGSININASEQDSFNQFFNENFPSSVVSKISRAENIRLLRNSKGRKTDSNSVVFLKGDATIQLNGETVDLNTYSKKHGLFSTVLSSLICEKLCFVENLYSFLYANKTIPNDYIFLHSYGRIGSDLLDKIDAKDILVFSDYDFVGLNEYLTVKKRFLQAVFFLPENYDDLFRKFSKPMNNSDSKGQKPSKQVKNSTDRIVVKIREQLYNEKFFLEQEILTFEN